MFCVERGRVRDEIAVAPAPRDSEIAAEVKALRALIEQHPAFTLHNLDPQQLGEIQKLKNELDIIYAAIKRTKQEIATLHVTGFRGPEMARVTNELGAVVGGTEKATQSILTVAEEIDQMANTLAAALKSEHEKGLAQDIQDRVIKIFEACNFQDLTGQRITKVVATMKFIEKHIVRMIEIWGGIEWLAEFAPEAITERESDAHLLNGPKLDDDPGHASQNDIDALFN
jgi:chemotaxis protein CheZ